ncbi:MAG: hypothetical protein MPW14_13580 [Candidatus Manganitrophus sp.]|nr:hypothetical protein [Candidatus Manganitrophus sp.]MDC4223700.1 hypothetical protein [Candidatus Manganitrophus sp.]WDT70098.1 MAG: hypothetical protein MPW17_15205 [Candidatus Manganitrophus sp.]WDT78248.1 MAG: hypothetical protein MPW14_13580 [Candidatus Manganitrophus sp.]
MAANLPKQSTRLGIPFILLCLLIALQGCGGKSRSPEGEGFFRKESDTEIRFERSGGVAGIRTISTIHSESLPEEERNHLRSLIDRSGFFGLPEEIIGPPRPDQFLYTITVAVDGREHTVRTTETAAPEQLRLLIEWLNEAAKRETAHTG